MVIAFVPLEDDQFGNGRCCAVDGIIRKLRVSDMTLLAMDPEVAVQGPAATDFDHVARLLPAGRFTNKTPVDLFTLFIQVFEDLDGAVDRRPFFIAGEEKGDRTRVSGILFHESFARRDHGGNAAFHVGCAPAVEVTVAGDGLKGIRFPLLQGAGWHHIRMSGKYKQWSPGTMACPEIVNVIKSQLFDPETDLLQTPGKQRLATPVLRRDRRAADQFTGEFQDRAQQV